MCWLIIREIGPYRTSQFQSWAGIKVDIGEEREFMLYSCPKNHSGCSYLYMWLYAGAMLLRTGHHSVLVCRTTPALWSSWCYRNYCISIKMYRPPTFDNKWLSTGSDVPGVAMAPRSMQCNTAMTFPGLCNVLRYPATNIQFLFVCMHSCIYGYIHTHIYTCIRI